MNEWVDEWMNGWMNGWFDEKKIDEQMKLRKLAIIEK